MYSLIILAANTDSWVQIKEIEGFSLLDTAEKAKAEIEQTSRAAFLLRVSIIRKF
jgi:hypothetical protein